jgi:hypothetical protein
MQVANEINSFMASHHLQRSKDKKLYGFQIRLGSLRMKSKLQLIYSNSHVNASAFGETSRTSELP